MINGQFKIFKKMFWAAISLLITFSASAKLSEPKEAGLLSSETARDLKDVTIEQHLGAQLDLSLQFSDETGKTVQLKDYFDGKTPVAISLVYFGCPGLCSFHLNGVVDSLKPMDWSIGRQFKYLVISFDPKENATLASAKKENYLKIYNKDGAENGWHFLTGSQDSITRLTTQIGFRYQWKEETQEWAHASALTLLTPSGTIARYLHGIMFDPKTFKLALMESTEGKIGSIVDKMIWYCFHYDPKQSKYTLIASKAMKLGGVLILIVLGAIMVPFWMRAKKEIYT